MSEAWNSDTGEPGGELSRCIHMWKRSKDGGMVCLKCGASMTMEPIHPAIGDNSTEPDQWTKQARRDRKISRILKGIGDFIIHP